MTGNMYMVSAALAVVATAAQSQQPLQQRAVSVAANPGKVCLDTRRPSYLNFDLVVQNANAEAVKVDRIVAEVLDARGEVVETRMLAAQALDLLGSARTVGAEADANLFNPLMFNSVKAGSRIKYRITLEGRAEPLELTVAPVDCTPLYRSTFPVAGRVLISDGHDFLSHHRRGTYNDKWSKSFGIIDNFQRFGLDMSIIDAGGRMFNGDGRRNEDWFGWGAPVRAAAAGTVTNIHNDQPDNDVVGKEDRWKGGITKANPMSSYGNYVLIKHGEGEYSLAAHLKQGSVSVKEGQQVKPGDTIGQMGNSGSSIAVHLHFERRTGWGLSGIRTLPPYFQNVGVVGTGERGASKAIAVNTGDIILAR